jgi:hypothetical protein
MPRGGRAGRSQVKLLITNNAFCIVQKATAQSKTGIFCDFGVAEAPPGFQAGRNKRRSHLQICLFSHDGWHQIFLFSCFCSEHWNEANHEINATSPYGT